MRSEAAAPLPLIRPVWPGEDGPHIGPRIGAHSALSVGAAMTTRQGGVSAAPWHTLNLGLAVGDAAEAVAENRRRHAQALGVPPVWLRQVHGTQVLRWRAGDAWQPEAPADAVWTTERGVACTVLVADCLPVLLALRDGSAVAAAHAGWRGLAAGVLQASVRALCEGSGARPHEVLAWLGPCIGAQAFEVGAEVLTAFGRSTEHQGQGQDPSCFVWQPRADGSPRWRADLQGLAREALAAAGVTAIGADSVCTVADASRFFSFRRDGVTGRMAASIWRL